MDGNHKQRAQLRVVREEAEARSTRGKARLQQLFGVLKNLIVDDARAADVAESNRRAELLMRQNSRAECIDRLKIPVEPAIRDALVAGRTLPPTAALMAVQRWLDCSAPLPTLVLVGHTGVGKSVAACYAVSRRDDAHSVRWHSARAVVRTFAGYFGEALVAQQHMSECHLLVIEDAGTEDDQGRFGGALLELLEERGKDPARRTIITTNLAQRDFFAAYPDVRLHSRLSSRLAQWAYCSGRDLRSAR